MKYLTFYIEINILLLFFKPTFEKKTTSELNESNKETSLRRVQTEEEKVQIKKFLKNCIDHKLIQPIPEEKPIPKISIVMSAYNEEKLILNPITSIQNQNFTEWELIIMDDGSTDKTNEIVTKVAKKDKRIKLVKNEKNRGLLYSVSKGISLCKGKYFINIDADDLFSLPYVLDFLYKKIEETGVNIIHFSSITGSSYDNFMFYPNSSPVQTRLNEIIIQPELRHWNKKNRISCYL